MLRNSTFNSFFILIHIVFFNIYIFFIINIFRKNVRILKIVLEFFYVCDFLVVKLPFNLGNQ